MSPTWHSTDLPETAPIGAAGWMRALVRGAGISVLFAASLLFALLFWPVERLVWARRRPVTRFLSQVVFRATLVLLGLSLRVEGAAQVPRAGGARAIVSNHVSWIDIIALNAAQQVTFVSKVDVAGWPVIGHLARFVGTVFITRSPRDAQAQRRQLADALAQGQVLALFPEATSTDGMRLLPFKSTLLSAFYATEAAHDALIQPISISYDAPAGESDARFYGWWGDMALGPHMLRVLAQAPQGCVTLRRHAPISVADFSDRKSLAIALENAVREGMPADRRLRV